MAISPSEHELLSPRAAETAADAGAPIRQSSLWKDAWRRYVRNRGAVVAAVIFGLAAAGLLDDLDLFRIDRHQFRASRVRGSRTP